MFEYQFGYMYVRYDVWNFVDVKMTYKEDTTVRMETG
jgi:hypothetical protein